MTVVVLHRASLGDLPYGEWLGGDAIVVTDHTGPTTADARRADGSAGAPADGPGAAVEIAVQRAGVLAEVAAAGRGGGSAGARAAGPGHGDRVASAASAASAELAVLDLAANTHVTALVALHPDDQIRAGSLRDHLGLPGQTRDEAVVGADAVRAAELLGAAGVPVVRRAPAATIPDLYRAAHTWGYPLVVRGRRGAERAVVAELLDETGLRAFARGGLAEGDTAATAGLTVEPAATGPRHRGPGNPATDAALAVLPAVPGHPFEVEAVRDALGTWRVDTVRYRGRTADARHLVCAQARRLESVEAV